MSIVICLCLLAGAAIGFGLLILGDLTLQVNFLIQPLLYLLLLAVGVDLGLSIREHGWKSLLSAAKGALTSMVGTITGSLIGGLAAGALTGLALRPSLAVAAGFGWYTLSSITLAGLGGPLLGAVAFLSNVLRESLSILLVSGLCRRGLKASAVSAVGAPSMDVALPMLSQSGGPQLAAAGFVHGLVISLLVPVLVPLLYGAG